MIKNRKAILALLTGLNFLNYIDRTTLFAVLPKIEKDFSLSHFQDGCLATAFLAGYFLTSPFFGSRADRGKRTGLIAAGVVVWSIATIASGFAVDFWSLLLTRVFVGVGEASYATLAPTIIDDITPIDRKGKALAVFYLAIPLGSAIGFLLGGFIGQHLGWREAFWVAGGPGIVLAISCLFIVEPVRKLADAKANVIESLKAVARIPLFRRAVLGYVAYTAATGAFQVFAPDFLMAKYPKDLTLQSANTYFGAVLLAGGAVGTLIGGWMADKAQREVPVPPGDDVHAHPQNKRGINGLLKISAMGMVLAAPLTFVAYLMPTPLGFFAIVFAIAIGLFLSTSPINGAMLRAVPSHLRASAMAAGIFAIHLFGDLWSPPALGVIVDVSSQLVGMLVLAIVFAASAWVWWPRPREAA